MFIKSSRDVLFILEFVMHFIIPIGPETFLISKNEVEIPSGEDV